MAKKKKNADFQKVKFKVGKKLPKSENFTDTAFKSRSIVIREQLKSALGEPVSKNKHTLQELLTQTQHHNATVRQTAVAGLQELVGSHPDTVRQHAGTTLDTVLALCSDRDGTVRASAAKFVDSVLGDFDEAAARPFFATLGAHLCRALTHLSDAVRLDALGLLDIILGHYPRFVVARASQLLTIFVDQISKVGRDSRRTLNINPDSLLSEQRTRSQVLGRICQLLQAVLDEPKASCAANLCAENRSNDGQECATMKMYYYCSGLLPYQSVKGIQNAIGGQLDITEDDQVLDIESFVSSISQLLAECWFEAMPSSAASQASAGHLVKQRDVAVLYNVTSIATLTWRLLKQREGRSADSQVARAGTFLGQGRALAKAFLVGFPYAASDHHSDQRAKGKMGRAAAAESSVEGLNATISCFIAVLASDSTSCDISWTKRVVDYVTSALGDRHRMLPQRMTELLDCTCLLVPHLPEHDDSTTKMVQCVRQLLERTLQKSNVDNIVAMLQFVKSIALSTDSQQSRKASLGMALIQPLLAMLRDADSWALLKKCGVLAVSILKPLVVHGKHLLSEQDLASCLGSLAHICVTLGCADDGKTDFCHVSSYLLQLFGLIYYMREELTRATLVPLSGLLRLLGQTGTTLSYCLHALQHRYLNGSLVNEADYISFLFSLLLEDSYVCSGLCQAENMARADSGATWHRAQVVCDVLLRFPDVKQLACVLSAFIRRFMTKHTIGLSWQTCATLLFSAHVLDRTDSVAADTMVILVGPLLLHITADSDVPSAGLYSELLASILAHRADVLSEIVHNLHLSTTRASGAGCPVGTDSVLNALTWLLRMVPAQLLGAAGVLSVADELLGTHCDVISAASLPDASGVPNRAARPTSAQTLWYELRRVKMESQARGQLTAS